MNFVRYDVPRIHPKFGQIEPCTHPGHAEARRAHIAAVSGMPLADLGRQLTDLEPAPGNLAMLEAAQAMLDEPFGWLYLWGRPGNGKSAALIALVNGLADQGYGLGMYLTFSRLLDWMRSSFGERRERGPEAGGAGYLRQFEQLLQLKVLAIDEMDKARQTPFAEDFRFHFLEERYRQATNGQSVTLFASNAPPYLLPEPLYDRISDGRFKIVENRAESARPRMKREG